MKRATILYVSVLLALTIGFIVSNRNVTPVSAKPADTLTIDWYTIDGGGATNLTGGTFTLSGTVGQFDASSTAQVGSYGLTAGFWAAWNLPSYSIFLPLIQKAP